MEIGRKRKTSYNDTFHLDVTSKKKAEKLFKKKTPYLKNADTLWELPPSLVTNQSYPPWIVPELQDLKKRLNELKDKLSDKEIAEWHNHTQFTNLAGNIVQDVRQVIRPELCTQAWCKFYELISTFDIVDTSLSAFNSVHLCEAPGAFVTSLNHFLISNG